MLNYYADKKVLVTGGCGFIGSYVAEDLVACGAQVTVLDDLSTGNLAHIAHIRDKLTFIQGSITDREMCLEVTQNKSHIFHLAAFVSVPQSVEEPGRCHAVNVDGTFNLLEAARLNAVQRVIFSSSSAVYGSGHAVACNEQTSCNPASPYGFSKLIGEYLCKQYARNFGVETVCMRYFNVYGERQNAQSTYAGVVARFRYLMARNLPITISGDGRQTRDFIPVEQVAHYNLLLGSLPEMMKGEVFNIASGKSISILDLFEQLRAEFPEYKLAPQFASARPGDVSLSAADCSKMQALLRCEQERMP